MPPQFTKDEWYTEVDETEGNDLPESPILTVTVHDEDETNKFQYKVSNSNHNFSYVTAVSSKLLNNFEDRVLINNKKLYSIKMIL